MMNNSYVKLVESNDMVGVELGGTFKNVYAIGIGICDGLGYSLNAKAAVLTKALQELAELTFNYGGKKLTAYGLAGLGDLIATAMAEESRNRRFGENLGKGMNRKDALREVGQTVEGVDQVLCILRLAKFKKIKLALAETIARCLEGKVSCQINFEKFFKQYK